MIYCAKTVLNAKNQYANAQSFVLFFNGVQRYDFHQGKQENSRLQKMVITILQYSFQKVKSFLKERKLVMYLRVCKVCEKCFESPTERRTTCSETCRDTLKKITREKRMSQIRPGIQICEKCQRATGKRIDSIVCPWARNLEPVPNWEANEIYVEETGWSYDIISCPLFLKDEKIRKTSLLGDWQELCRTLKNYN